MINGDIRGLFQSTLPTRGETPKIELEIRKVNDFNPLSPHGERQANAQALINISHFNPLSPHVERPIENVLKISKSVFQSTLPTRGETFGVCTAEKQRLISIHSPHTGRDAFRR